MEGTPDNVPYYFVNNDVAGASNDDPCLHYFLQIALDSIILAPDCSLIFCKCIFHLFIAAVLYEYS